MLATALALVAVALPADAGLPLVREMDLLYVIFHLTGVVTNLAIKQALEFETVLASRLLGCNFSS